MRKLVRKFDVGGLGVTEVRVNVARSSVEEKLEKLFKTVAEGRVTHRYNSNENIDLSQ